MVAADAIILGSPNWHGMTADLKAGHRSDRPDLGTGQAGWQSRRGIHQRLVAQSAGRSSRLLTLLHTLLAHGMLIVGLPWSKRMVKSGSYYGPTAVGGPTEDDLGQARALGRRVAHYASLAGRRPRRGRGRDRGRPLLSRAPRPRGPPLTDAMSCNWPPIGAPPALHSLASMSSSAHAEGHIGWLEHSIAGIAHSIERAVFTEELARQPGWLQRIDPRAKVLMFLIVVIAASASTSLGVLVALYVVILAVARASRLPFNFFVKRVWLGIPLFAGIVIAPSIFLAAGPRLFDLAIGPVHVGVSAVGMWSAIVFVARVGVSVSLAVLLVLTTPWADLLKSCTH